MRSSRGFFVKVAGLRWLSLQVVVRPGFAKRTWGLPFLTILSCSEQADAKRKRRHQTLPEKASWAMRLVARWCPGRRLVMVGDGAYASLDVFVHSGPHDTFGQTIQEAAASGLPVVAPAAGGPADLVQDGVTGFLVAPGDPAALAAGVARLAADPALRATQSAAARRAMTGRTWPALCDELIGHYDAVLRDAARPAGQAAPAGPAGPAGPAAGRMAA